MSKIILISNRLPVTVRRDEQGNLEYIESIGGLATGLKSIHGQGNSIWIGWAGISDEDINLDDKINIRRTLIEKYKCFPVFLSVEEIDKYYHGFSNKTIWPLFHYFTEKTEYDFDNWKAYKNVNNKFFEAIEEIIEVEDTVWIHDYQLMLLPELVKNKFSRTQIGFFLHIPFPSIEIFRGLIWRNEILNGILGADLIGFHTYDYVRHFLSCTRRLLGLEDSLNTIAYEDRYIKVDAFPMGIEYDRFYNYQETENLLLEGDDKFINDKNIRRILSIDRLDYTKGIPQRIRSFDKFLERYPEYQGRVILNLIVAPSRTGIDKYDELLKEINERISITNGKYATLNWMPIWFFFRSFTQEILISFYRRSDVLLVTPLRDGMNLIAKEYIASRNDYGGMVVLSETAGAASELGEAIIINANDYHSTALGIKEAIDMSKEEKIARNKIMHRRLKRYNVSFWSSEFINSLKQTVQLSKKTNIQLSAEENIEEIKKAYKKAKNRILFLDYDGTLVGFSATPEQAKPDSELTNLLNELTSDPQNTVVLISGRDRAIMTRWFGCLNVFLAASHGLWLSDPDQDDWTMFLPLENEWKNAVRGILELYTDRMPGSFIEEKEFSLVWHFRRCDPDIVAPKIREIKDTISSMTQSSTLGIQLGNKILEVKDSRFNKGYVALGLIQDSEFDFIIGVGDDETDEDLFSSLPKDAYTIKIGLGKTSAKYRMKSWRSVRRMLKEFVGQP